MKILQIPEIDVSTDLERARSVASASFERGGLKYDWVATYSSKSKDKARERCQDLQASGRMALLVCHANGNLTVWQGAAGSFQPSAPARPAIVAPSAAIVPEPAPKPAEKPLERQAVTVKYRGRTLTKSAEVAVCERQPKGQRRYRGKKY